MDVAQTYVIDDSYIITVYCVYERHGVLVAVIHTSINIDNLDALS